MSRKFVLLFVVGAFAACVGNGQKPVAREIPRLVEKDGRHALMVDGAPFLMLGVQVNNSSAWPAMLPQVWPAIEAVHANTVEVPIYWEQFEPRAGEFDDSVLKTLLVQARAHNVRLVLLWFGTWKNGSGHYTPEWIKRDNVRYPHVVSRSGRNVDSLSPHGTATLEADRRAFAALMRRLKALDPERTVLMVQVENEAGTWGSVRDFSTEAQRLFNGPVPERLANALNKKPGTWQETFGDDADEFFHAWSIARYIEQVAAAGKAEYPLPMYVNVALRDPLQPGKANTYESGGPTDNVIPIWKAAGPSVDAIGPDVYMSEYAKFLKVLDLYGRPDNALFVPELGRGEEYARYFYASLGHGAIGFSPFGLDYTAYDNDGQPTLKEQTLARFALNYQTAAPMQRELARLNFEGKLQGVSEDPQVHERSLRFGKWTAVVSFGKPVFGFGKAAPGNPEPVGGVFVAELGESEFLVSGSHVRVDFSPVDAAGLKQRQFLRVEEGAYKDGRWKATRTWNGDQTDYGLNFTGVSQVLRVTLATY